MRLSEFWQAMTDVFGPQYAKSLASDLVMGSLGGITAADALSAGIAPREVWVALCDAMEVPESRRWPHREAKRK
jgi:hypothetical protein